MTSSIISGLLPFQPIRRHLLRPSSAPPTSSRTCWRSSWPCWPRGPRWSAAPGSGSSWRTCSCWRCSARTCCTRSSTSCCCRCSCWCRWRSCSSYRISEATLPHLGTDFKSRLLSVLTEASLLNELQNFLGHRRQISSVAISLLKVCFGDFSTQLKIMRTK